MGQISINSRDLEINVIYKFLSIQFFYIIVYSIHEIKIIAKQVLNGLSFLHSEEITHTDLKVK